eukprot:1159157-Pelagomonas_calceolata.AAC.5
MSHGNLCDQQALWNKPLLQEKVIATLARSYLKNWLRSHGALVRPPKSSTAMHNEQLCICMQSTDVKVYLCARHGLLVCMLPLLHEPMPPVCLLQQDDAADAVG